jgi:DNA-directed RNA polymerase subunit omega
MADRWMTMMNPPVEDLLDKVDSKFTLVALAAKRARQINSYFNSLGDGLGTIVPPQVTSVARKPLSISLEEVAAGKIVYVRPARAARAALGDPLRGRVGFSMTRRLRPRGKSLAC